MFEFTYTESDCEQFCLTDQLINYITYDDMMMMMMMKTIKSFIVV